VVRGLRDKGKRIKDNEDSRQATVRKNHSLRAFKPYCFSGSTFAKHFFWHESSKLGPTGFRISNSVGLSLSEFYRER
jgi:hypothetical protein